MNGASLAADNQELWPQAGPGRARSTSRGRGGNIAEYMLATVIFLMLILAILGW